MAIVFIEFKKQWLGVDDYEELFAEAVFDKTFLREIIYHDIITPMPKFVEYINSGRFIRDFLRNKNHLEYEERGLRLIAEEIKTPERLLEKVEQALKDAINYEYTDQETAKILQSFREVLSKL
jgi:ketol-acid reductoisomerase